MRARTPSFCTSSLPSARVAAAALGALALVAGVSLLPGVSTAAFAAPPAAAAAQSHNPGAIAAPPDVAAPPADAATTPSGLASKVLRAGTGTVHPGPTDQVTVHYTGWTTDGTMFDSSVVRGKPAAFRLNRVISGWSEGVQLMVVGEKCRLWIPAKLAYAGHPDKPQGTLVFDIELLDIVK